MCGICGFVSKTVDDRTSMEQTLRQMCTTIAHRGPDEQGQYIDAVAGVALGHQRLSIIDLATGQQPLANEVMDIFVIFNGEIYNFADLRVELEQNGHVFATHSDTEVIVHSYEQWGEECVQHFRGMFAFAIWDKRKKRLFCARDRLGIKPFYYYWDGKTFIFGSEIKALLAHEVVRPELDPAELINYLRLFYIPAPGTIYRKIFKLRPGHILVLEGGAPKVSAYWNLDTVWKEESKISLPEAAERLRAFLEEAVRIRLISEVPLGAFLSGGVDSSSVVGLMSRIMEQRVQTHTVRFKEKQFDESPYAAYIAELFNCDHSEITVQPNVRGVLPKLVWHMDEPFADSSMIPTYYICQAARKRVTVCLSGDGGDELFAGYNWYSELLRLERLDACLPAVVKQIASALPSVVPWHLRGATLLRNLAGGLGSRHLNLVGAFPDVLIARLLGMKSQSHFPEHPLLALHNHHAGQRDPVTTAQHVDLQSYMVDDILMKVDKMSMAHSLEVRVPILDHKVVEFAFSLPVGLKIREKERKVVLKGCITDLIRKNYFNRPKQGFAIPQKQWLQNDLREYVNEYLLSPSAVSRDYFDMKEVKKLWQNLDRGMISIDLSQHVWALLCFELWGRTFLKSNSGLSPME